MGTFTQLEIDAVRLRVLRACARTALRYVQMGMADRDHKWPVNHLWFPERGNIDHYEMRHGNPPANIQRPGYLKGLDLEIDILAGIPASVRRAIEENSRRAELLRNAVGVMHAGVSLEELATPATEEEHTVARDPDDPAGDGRLAG